MPNVARIRRGQPEASEATSSSSSPRSLQRPSISHMYSRHLINPPLDPAHRTNVAQSGEGFFFRPFHRAQAVRAGSQDARNSATRSEERKAGASHRRRCVGRQGVTSDEVISCGTNIEDTKRCSTPDGLVFFPIVKQMVCFFWGGLGADCL